MRLQELKRYSDQLLSYVRRQLITLYCKNKNKRNKKRQKALKSFSGVIIISTKQVQLSWAFNMHSWLWEQNAQLAKLLTIKIYWENIARVWSQTFKFFKYRYPSFLWGLLNRHYRIDLIPNLTVLRYLTHFSHINYFKYSLTPANVNVSRYWVDRFYTARDQLHSVMFNVWEEMNIKH